jgi:WS/DGAT/MGAT family acyltransferase
MEHLSGLDAAFLHLETPETPMHVGGLHLFEMPTGYDGDFYEDVKAHVARRMHLAPVFTRKLAPMPFELANPVWIDDADIDLDYHLRRIVLSRPGSLAQLETYVGRLHSTLMDRSRPLWEFYVIDGLKDGRVGFYSKVHHAAVDGQAGVALANAILDLGAVPREVKPGAKKNGKYQLGVAELVGAALSNQLMQYAKLIKLLPGVARTVTQAATQAAGRAIAARRQSKAQGEGKGGKPAAAKKAGRNWQIGPRTALNVAITNQRAFATASIPFAEIRALGKSFEASVNDVVLALCSGALRRYLENAGGVPAKPLIAAVPVSLRQEGDASLNNQATMTLVNLNTHLADPMQRVAAIRRAAGAMKAQMSGVKGVIPTDFPSLGAPWLLSGLASLYGRSRLADRLPPLANVVISNVPGPQFPLYLAGGKMTTYYPVSIVIHGIALNITVQSYNGSLDFGFIACRRAVPDVRELAGHILEAHAELGRLAQELAAQAEPEAKVRPASAGKKATMKKATAKKVTAKGGAVKKAAESTAKAPAKRVSAKAAAKTATKTATRTAAKSGAKAAAGAAAKSAKKSSAKPAKRAARDTARAPLTVKKASVRPTVRRVAARDAA